MRLNRTQILGLAFIGILLAALVVSQAAVAQHEDSHCDLEELIAHQNEHAQELANFAEEARTNLNAALATLYRTAIAYQALAIECGFTQSAAVEAAHELQHADFNTDTHADKEAALAVARSVGDPERGKILFNTIRTEVSFACATCHRVDSTERLVGPGLLGIGGHAHDHNATAQDSHDTMSGMNMGATPAPTDTHDAMNGMNRGAATAEAASTPERTLEETVEFLRTSIVDPSAYVMPGFPDDLMPKVYGTIFTEEQINDLIAYLLTLN